MGEFCRVRICRRREGRLNKVLGKKLSDDGIIISK